MKNRENLVFASLEKAFQLFRFKHKIVLINFIKISFLELVILFFSVYALYPNFFAQFDPSFSTTFFFNSPSVNDLLLLIGIIMYVTAFIHGIYWDSLDKYTQNHNFDLLSSIKANFFPVTFFILLSSLPFIFLYGIVLSSLSGLMAILMLLIIVLYVVFLLFVYPELVINKRSVMGSIKRSIKLVKNNFLKTILLVISLAIINKIIEYVFETTVGVIIDALPVELLVGSQFFIIYIPIQLFRSLIDSISVVGPLYFFWKSIAVKE